MRIIPCLFGVLFLIVQICKGQNNAKEKDSVYYYLDTAAVPIKDRMIFKDSLDFTTIYSLRCKCNLWGSNIDFERPKSIKSKPISPTELKKINTVSISDLISIVLSKMKDTSQRTSYFIIEPNGKDIEISKVFVMPPRRIHRILDGEAVHINPGEN
ncbi:hypothetical protein [Pedobacter gandavensis]|uniref:hypothetical protein n=1 Tax=Pedobacter gandavensis TaxID=2679963 RepID=UPI002931A22B|nr:hypothetical protein [Pedobacter gandavensis]